ncbi:hypothetical protein LTR17_000006 [Elasticomyces elasticus]|nr:hypothetical protein LTR17_000006 [Elasticomyces elasticus]
MYEGRGLGAAHAFVPSVNLVSSTLEINHGQNVQPSTSGGGERRTAARSSSRRTTQSSRLQEPIADGVSGISGTETNSAAAAASSNVSRPPPRQSKQKEVKKASRPTSSWNGPVYEQRKGKKNGARRTGSEQDPIDLDDEQSALDLLSTHKTANLSRYLQKSKLSGDLMKSSDASALSKHLLKISNPLATQIEEASDWEETQRRKFNRWAGQDGAHSARIASGNDHASVLDSPSKASDALINTTGQQPVETQQRASTNPFGFRPMPNYSRYPDVMAEASMMPPPRSGMNFSGSGVDAGTARQHEDNERLRLVASKAQLPALLLNQHTSTQAPGAVSSSRRSLFDAIHSRRDSAIGLPGTAHTSPSSAGSYASFASPSLQAFPTSSIYTSGLSRRPEPLLLRQFYWPKPRTADTASSVGRTGISVQAGSEAASSAEEDELATIPDQFSKKSDSVQAPR